MSAVWQQRGSHGLEQERSQPAPGWSSTSKSQDVVRYFIWHLSLVVIFDCQVYSDVCWKDCYFCVLLLNFLLLWKRLILSGFYHPNTIKEAPRNDSPFNSLVDWHPPFTRPPRFAMRWVDMWWMRCYFNSSSHPLHIKCNGVDVISKFQIFLSLNNIKVVSS